MSELDLPDFDAPDAAPPPPPGGSLLAPVEVEVTRINDESSDEAWLQALNDVCHYIQKAKALESILNAVGLEIFHRRGPITVSPTVRYVSVFDKTTKCKDLRGTVEKLWDAAAGDMERFVGVLASGALKPGAAKRLLSPEDYAACFEVVVKERLKEDGGGKVEKLVRVDDLFLPVRK